MHSLAAVKAIKAAEALAMMKEITEGLAGVKIKRRMLTRLFVYSPILRRFAYSPIRMLVLASAFWSYDDLLL